MVSYHYHWYAIGMPAMCFIACLLKCWASLEVTDTRVGSHGAMQSCSAQARIPFHVTARGAAWTHCVQCDMLYTYTACGPCLLIKGQEHPYSPTLSITNLSQIW